MIFQTLAAASIGFASLAMPQTASKDVIVAQAQPFVGTQGIVSPRLSSDFMTTAQGCTYRKTQAPGYPPRWILVVNPQVLGMPMPPRGCRGMM